MSNQCIRAAMKRPRPVTSAFVGFNPLAFTPALGHPTRPVGHFSAMATHLTEALSSDSVSQTSAARSTGPVWELKREMVSILRACARPTAATAAEVRRFVEEAITAGQLTLALELVEGAAAAETTGAAMDHRLITADIFHRLLTIATYSQNMELGDKLVSIALQAPATRIDMRVVELYAALVGDAPTQDFARGLAFCNLMLELGYNAFAPYLAALNRCHGEAGLALALEYFLKESLSFEAVRCVQTALLNLGSRHITRMFSKMLELAQNTSTEAEHARAKMIEEAHELTINGLLQLQRTDEAYDILAKGWDSYNAELTYATFLVAKKLVSILSLNKPTPNAGLDVIVEEALRSSVQETSPPVSTADPTPGSLQITNRLAALTRCLHTLITHQALRPRLLFNAMMVFRGFGMTRENMQVAERMLDDPIMRTNVLASRHINPLLVDLVKAGHIDDAERLFQRIASLDGKYRLTRPNSKTYNILIHHAAKMGDKDTVKDLMAQMSEQGLKPDASTLAAIPMLRTSRLTAGSTTDAPAEERDTDDLLQRTIAAAVDAATGLAVGRNTFNQIIQSYFRVGKTAKAVSVLKAMASVRSSPAQDTFRTLLQGITLSGGAEITGTSVDKIPVTWGGTLPTKAYEDQRRHATVLRAKVAAGTATGHLPSQVLQQGDAKQLRMAGISETLATIRTALYHSRGSIGNEKRLAVSETAATEFGCSWLLQDSGKNLLQQLESFQPWPRNAANRQSRLYALRESLGWGPSAGNAWQNNQATGEEPDSSDLEDEEEVAAGLEDTFETHKDLLPYFPKVFWMLRSMGMPLSELYRLGDIALSWAATFLAPRRSLQLFVTLYNFCLWEDKLTIGDRAMALVPGLVTVDLRRVHVASACAFFHTFLSHLATQHILGREVPFAGQDVAFLVGLKPGRLHAQMEELARLDVIPPMHFLASERALIFRAENVRAWLAAEMERVKAAKAVR